MSRLQRSSVVPLTLSELPSEPPALQTLPRDQPYAEKFEADKYEPRAGRERGDKREDAEDDEDDPEYLLEKRIHMRRMR